MLPVTTLEPAEAARATGLSLDTLRYYDREGLIGPIDRSTGGQRHYHEDDVAWIGLVTYLRDAGLGIADLRGSPSCCAPRTPAATGSSSCAAGAPSCWTGCTGRRPR